MNLRKNWFFYVIGIVLVLILIKQCEQEPKTITKTKIEYIKVTDTITETIISEVPRTVYVERTKTVYGKDSIVFVNTPTDSTITAKQYDTKLSSNNAIAELKITTTGELLDVTGTITYEKEVKTIEITKTKPKSGLFIYADVPVSGNVQNLEAGLLYQIRNTMLLKGGVQYNSLTKSPDIKIGIGIRIF